MRFILYVFLLATFNGLTQEVNLDSEEKELQLRMFLTMVKEDLIISLSEHTEYPLERPKPLPHIKNKSEFLLSYPVLLDDSIKSELLSINIFDETNVIFSGGSMGLLNGNIWLNYEGHLKALNYSTKQERKNLSRMNTELKSIMHSSVNDWSKIELLKRTEKYIIKLDRMPDGSIRYASWNIPRVLDSEPSIVLNNGEVEHYGSGGSHGFIFTNGDWKYVVEYVAFCEEEKYCGYFLKLYNGEEMVSETKLVEVF